MKNSLVYSKKSFISMFRCLSSTVTLLFLFLSVVPASVLAQNEIVCIQCHGNLKGRLGEPVKLWKGSIHAKNGIVCNGCHGGDPNDMANAMSPARGFTGAPKEIDIPGFCGRCHVGVKRDYLQSAHGKALGKGGPTCVTCHGNHFVVKASLNLINEKSCTRCHSFDRARIIKEAMQQTENHLAAIDKEIYRYRDKGVATDNLEKGLFAVRNRFHTLFHDVDVAKIRSESEQINADLKKLDQTLFQIADEHAKRGVIGALVVGLALLAALLFHLLKRNYDEN